MQKQSTKEESPTASMQYDVITALKGKYLFDSLPELKKIKGIIDYFEQSNDKVDVKKKVVAYVVLVYSKDSILNEQPIPKLSERQRKAAMMVGFKTDSAGNFPTAVEDRLFTLDGKYYSNMVFSFLVSQNDMLWEEIIADEQYRLRLLKEMYTTDNEKSAKDRAATLEKVAKLRQEIMNLRLSLVERYKEIFADIDNPVKTARQELTMTTLEKMAE